MAMMLLLLLLGGPWNGKFYLSATDCSLFDTVATISDFNKNISVGGNCRSSEIAKSLHPAPGEAVPLCHTDASPECQDMDWRWFGDCQFPPQFEWKARSLESCLSRPRGKNQPTRAAFLIGDSHAGHLRNGLEAALQGQYSLLVAWTPCCIMIPPSLNITQGKVYDSWMIDVWNQLEEKVAPGDVIVLSMWFAKFGNAGDWCGAADRRCRSWKQMAKMYESWITFTASHNASLILAGDSPNVPCTASIAKEKHFQKAVAECAFHETPQLIAVDNALAQLAREHPHVYHLPLRSFFCPRGKCSMVVPGTSIISKFDGGHLTTMASFALWPTVYKHVLSWGLLS